MPLPELTPEQLEQLNAISGLGKTRKRKDAPSGDNLPDVAPADLMQTALQQDDNAGFEPRARDIAFLGAEQEPQIGRGLRLLLYAVQLEVDGT